jgi:hypothetical protein
MTTAAPVPTAPSPFERMARAVWTDLPRAVARLSPSVGRALNDRAGWLDATPPLPALVVPAALLLGGVFGAFHWGCPAVYSSSLTVTASLLAISCACGAGVGVWLTFGYAVGDFLIYSHPYELADTPANVIGLRVGLIVSYIGLYILLALVPMTASAARRAAGAKAGNVALGIAAQLTVAGAFAFAWAQSVPLMLRPMFVWAPDPTLEKVPPIGAINPVQSNGLVFALVAVVFSIGMVVMVRPDAEAWSPPPTLLAKTGPAQGFIRAFVSAALFTLMFSGLASSVVDFVVLYGLVLTAAVLRLGILPLLPAYMREVARVPLVVRIVVPIVIGGAAGFYLISLVFADNDLRYVQLSFMPVILSLGIGLIVAAFALPAAAPAPALEQSA